MTAPLHARDIPGRGRWYGACGTDGCPFGDHLEISVTNAQGVVDKPALSPSAAKITAEAAWDRLPQMVATSRQPEAGVPADKGKPCSKRSPVSTRCGACRFCVTAAIKAEYRQQWEAKAELGTRIHTHAHAHVLGRPLPLDPEVEPFLAQYLRFLDEWKINLDRHIEAAETTIWDPVNGYAGTGDLWAHLPIGSNGRRQLALVDIKTSLTKPANAVYDDQVLQLAGLRYAPSAILPDDTLVDVPVFAGAFLLNLRQADYALIPLPADEAAHAGFVHAVGLRRFMTEVDSKTWTPLPNPLAPKAAVA